MSDPRAAVGNASDPEQVEEAQKKDKVRSESLTDAWNNVLATPSGRRLVWDLLEYCSVFTSIYSDSLGRLAHNSGRQDVGHFVLRRIDESRPEALLEMMAQDKKEKRQ